MFLAQKTKDAIVDRFRELYEVRPRVRSEGPGCAHQSSHIQGRIASHIALDASGRSMNQRGYRQRTGKAAINEVLAAGLISLSLWDPETPFVDPMCGSGTIPDRSGHDCQKRAPALLNDIYGLKRWPIFARHFGSGLSGMPERRERRDVDWIYGGDQGSPDDPK
jgi:putative N6-adenine-specific DNA methylase